MAPASQELWKEAVQRLIAIEPILDARINTRGQLRIVYDASCVGMRDIEPLLDEMGLALAHGLRTRMKLAWYRFLDANAKSNSTASGACCNRPPSAYGGSSDAGKSR